MNGEWCVWVYGVVDVIIGGAGFKARGLKKGVEVQEAKDE